VKKSSTSNSEEVVRKLREGLSDCSTTDASGREQLTVTLPNREALDNLASTLVVKE